MPEGYYDDYDKRRQFVSHLIKFGKDQLVEINAGHLMGIDLDLLTLYARPEFDYLSMRMIRDCIIDKMDYEKIKLLANPKFNYSQMILIKAGFEKGLTVDQVSSYANPDYTFSKMKEIMSNIVWNIYISTLWY